MAKTNETETTAKNINLIGVGTEITGNIVSSGDIRIDGELNGNMKVAGKAVIGETGKIKGEITCKNADVFGAVNGKIMVHELLSLKSTSKVTGDIIVGKLAIEPGAQFTGHCEMAQGGHPAGIKPVQPEQQPTAK
ncbi:MAG: polymer-forming cytoskeletal protein [Bacteroidales bacterium]|nr:polymer-forming cytoskeletal protein [Bacteroidales bacterium]